MGEKEDWYAEFAKETKNAPNPVGEQISAFEALIKIFGIIFILIFIIEGIWLVIT